MLVHTSQNQSWPWLNMAKCLSLFKAHEVIPCIPVCPNHSTILKHTPIRFPGIPWPPLLFCKDLSSVIVGKITLIDIIIPSSPKFSWKEDNYRYVATYRLVTYWCRWKFLVLPSCIPQLVHFAFADCPQLSFLPLAYYTANVSLH